MGAWSKEYSKNNPIAFGWYYDEPIPVTKVGPRRMRFTEEFVIFDTVMPEGYEVDGATVPRPFWNILSPFTEGFPAACVHDRRHYVGMTWLDRKEADDEFFHNLRKCKLNPVRCFAAWLGVRFWAYCTFWRWEKTAR